MMKRFKHALLLSTLSALLFSTPTGAAQDPLAPLDFMVGTWVAAAPTSNDAPNRGGSSEITRDLGGTVLLRRDRMLLKDGSAMDMLMIIYPGQTGVRADYFDSDNHVIHYAASDVQPGRRVQFVSEGPAEAPAFRLTYDAAGTDLLVRFEIAPPGPQRAFKVLAEGALNRQ